ncbi:MAG: NRDE family protein [Bacillota bacterium]|nr:NRDE family protein [Bacillota bacterium]
MKARISMCLIVMALETHPQYRLILAANRDEFFSRQAQKTHFWGEYPGILAGRDLEQGGTWLGVSQKGMFGAITNYRDPAHHNSALQSRGRIITEYLSGYCSAAEYMGTLSSGGTRYNGFNLIAGDNKEVWYYSNYCDRGQKLKPGIYGLSNSLLDVAWPKVRLVKKKMENLLKTWRGEPEELLLMLADKTLPADSELPSTGVSLEWERRLAPIFIDCRDGYGTRASTILTIAYNGTVNLIERTFFPDGEWEEIAHEFVAAGAC